jgi:DNA invertase Pin-like site-specific DNA recombinase
MKSITEQNVEAYLRVSQLDLNLENQRPCLQDRITKEGFNPERVTWNTEELSSRKERPVKEAIMERARAGKVDAVIFARLDRWGRSMVELVTDIEELVKLNVRVIIPKSNFDVSTEEGGFNSTSRLVLQIFAAFAEFERAILSERTIDGIAGGRAKGRIPGRHPVDCGCGFKSKDGKTRHTGSVKVVRNDQGHFVRWDYPNKPDMPQEPIKAASAPAPDTNTASTP